MNDVLDVITVVAYCVFGILGIAGLAVILNGLWCALLDRPDRDAELGERAAVVSLDAWRRHDVKATPQRPPVSETRR